MKSNNTCQIDIMINLINILFIMTVNARGNCQHGSIVKQSVGILSRNLSIFLTSEYDEMENVLQF